MSDSVGMPSQTDQFAGYWRGADGQWRLVDSGGVPPGYWRASDGNWYPPGGSMAAPGQTSAGANVAKVVGIVVALVVALMVVCIAAITLLGNNASTKFEPVGGSIGSYEGP
jgi:hypothetical protein